jgi:chromatin segregation and condensation protein Rec8/ScpA/Scc1 (kleisin family)
MAATLVEIKSRSLAPAQAAVDADPSAPAAAAEDPRAELIRQLLAYQKFRTAAEVLEARRREFAERSARAGPPWRNRRGGRRAGRLRARGPSSRRPLLRRSSEIAASIDLTRVGDHMVEYDDTPISLHQEDHRRPID